jgi:hypothetical protein
VGFFLSFSNYLSKKLLGDFNAKVERNNIFKPSIVNKRLHKDSNDKVVRQVNFVTSKI